MAEVTACWAKWPASCSAGNLGASGACRLTGSTGGCPKVSERADCIEQIIFDTRARLAQSESQCGQLAQKQTELQDQVRGQQWVWKTTDKGEEDCTVHLVVEESLDWPNALWTTRCGWRLQYATPRSVASSRRACVPEVCADGVVCLMRVFCSGVWLGPIIALSLPLLGVIAAWWGYDLAVVERSGLEHTAVQPRRQTRNSGRIEKDTCVSRPEGGRAVCDLEGSCFISVLSTLWFVKILTLSLRFLFHAFVFKFSRGKH